MSATPMTRLPSAMFPSLSSSAAVEYQRTDERFPAALLWLPYAALTLLLSALLVASFVHFHCKNGHKYSKRRTTKGNGNAADKTGNISVVRHVAFSDDRTTPAQPGVAVIDCASTVTCFRCTTPPSGGQQRQHVPVIGWGDVDDRRLTKCNGDVNVVGVERPKDLHTVRRLAP